VQPRGEHAVRDGLRVEVGEGLGRDVVDEDVLEGFELLASSSVLAWLASSLRHGLLDHIGQQARLAGHHAGELLRAGDGLPLPRGEVGDEGGEASRTFRRACGFTLPPVTSAMRMLVVGSPLRKKRNSR
jgi:hypothetical protein